MTTDDLVQTLDETPEYRLQLMEILAQAEQPDGLLHPSNLGHLQPDIDEATPQALEYTYSTQQFLNDLLCKFEFLHQNFLYW